MAYGLRPVGFGGGGNTGYNTGGFTEYQMADSYAVNTFAGDIIQINESSTGYAERQNGATGESPTTSTVNTLGVAVGFRYTDTNGTPTWSQHWAQSGTDVYVMVADDPNQIFLIQGPAAFTIAQVGLNAAVTNFASSAGSTSTGNSGVTLATPATGNAALRVLGCPKDGSNESSSTPNLLVRWNFGVHYYAQNTAL